MVLTVKSVVRVMTPISVSSRNTTKCSHFSNAGFTLLEIILVLAIIGLASVLIFPNVGNFESRTFDSQIRQAASLLNFAKRAAVVQGRSASIEIYAVPILEASGPKSPNVVGYWEFSYGTLRHRDNTDVETEVDEKIEISFYPEGGSSGGTIFFNFEDREARIQINPFSGQVEVEHEY